LSGCVAARWSSRSVSATSAGGRGRSRDKAREIMQWGDRRGPGKPADQPSGIVPAGQLPGTYVIAWDRMAKSSGSFHAAGLLKLPLNVDSPELSPNASVSTAFVFPKESFCARRSRAELSFSDAELTPLCPEPSFPQIP